MGVANEKIYAVWLQASTSIFITYGRTFEHLDVDCVDNAGICKQEGASTTPSSVSNDDLFSYLR